MVAVATIRIGSWRRYCVLHGMLENEANRKGANSGLCEQTDDEALLPVRAIEVEAVKAGRRRRSILTDLNTESVSCGHELTPQIVHKVLRRWTTVQKQKYSTVVEQRSKDQTRVNNEAARSDHDLIEYCT